MSNIRIEKAELDALRQRRETLILQIKRSKEAVERSQELLRRIDDLLGKVEAKPLG
jgi:hypothetical protein